MGKAGTNTKYLWNMVKNGFKNVTSKTKNQKMLLEKETKLNYSGLENDNAIIVRVLTA